MLNFRFQFHSTKMVSSVRFCHDPHKELLQQRSVQKSNEDRVIAKPEVHDRLMVQYWNERAAVKKHRKEKSTIRSINNAVDLLRGLQSIHEYLTSISGILYVFQKRRERLNVIEQQYLPQRVSVLRSDLAAAHFIVERGGSVKFKGQQDWIGLREKKKILPITYIPGLFVESIKAERTDLVYEGLPNFSKLHYLTYLSLKDLKTMNDWCMDWISKDHYMNLKHLDISGCVNVTYRALSCFYRFECLEILNVEGIPDTIEFKLACLKLLEIRPHLVIRGIDLSIPKKIEALDENEIKHIPDSNKEIQKLKP